MNRMPYLQRYQASNNGLLIDDVFIILSIIRGVPPLLFGKYLIL